MKIPILLGSVFFIFSVAGFLWFEDVSETASVDSKLYIAMSHREEERAPVEHHEARNEEKQLSVISNDVRVKVNDISNFVDVLENAMRNGSDYFELASQYETAYETCNGELNTLYGEVARHSDTGSVPTPICLRVKDILIEALGRSMEIDEKLLLIEILARWEPIDAQLMFIRSYADIPPIITGLALAELERNSLYISSSIEDKISVIETFSALPSEVKRENAYLFFQTFVPIVIKDASQGVFQYFPQLAEVAETYPIPDIPEDIGRRDDQLQLAQQVPAFSNEEDFNRWAIANPDLFEDIRNLSESLDSDDLSAGALERIELLTSMDGRIPSPSTLVGTLENYPDDVSVYHVLREIRYLRNQGEYFADYYREVQQSETVRGRAEILLHNPEISDGQRSSVKKLYDEIWGS